jgi:amidohydrolase
LDKMLMTDYMQEARNHFDYAQTVRRDLHQHPELGFKEFRTSQLVTKALLELGIEVTAGVAETGVVGVLEGSRPGKTVLIRFDMDALPIVELSETDYVSQNPGVMHACGHDGHVAIGLTVAKILAAHRQDIKGCIKFIFQPAEEGMGGAKKMIEEGVLENPRPDYALAMHLWNEKPVGWAGAAPGPVMAGAELFRIVIHGKGGHGAMPHQTIDPILAASQVVLSLQSIVSRNVSPLKTAVVSVTQFNAGDAYNVIPQEVELRGTIRTFEHDVRETVLRRFEEIVKNSSEAMGCDAELEIWGLTPALINNLRIANVAQEILGENQAKEIDSNYQTMASEDMAEFLNHIPGLFLMVGSADPDRGLSYAHHHPRFDFDEQALIYGAGWISSLAIGLLEIQPAV